MHISISPKTLTPIAIYIKILGTSCYNVCVYILYIYMYIVVKHCKTAETDCMQTGPQLVIRLGHGDIEEIVPEGRHLAASNTA